ncbi:Dedicator of cytokinesis protein [Lachnellula suecica]|uniref:Dedicator of cytokinesis protein n=1 Tax=Lachnellula suecica TaxID=602035 RepID=A0A8T9BVV6_9HELO|nr:Dedicator of cytokinesis protein [Lachnellula suecica]
MPWSPLPRIAFAVATYPFAASSPADLPLELGDELYIIEQGGRHGDWFRGYLVAPPSLLAGLTSTKGQTLEARVFSGIFPRSCVEVREVLGDEDEEGSEQEDELENGANLSKQPLTNGYTNGHKGTGSGNSSVDLDGSSLGSPRSMQSLRKARFSAEKKAERRSRTGKAKRKTITNGGILAVPQQRDPNAPKPPAPVPMLKIGDETPTSASEPLVDEIASCLREWHSTNLHELLLSRQYPQLEKMSSLVQALDLSRRQFLHNVLTAQEMKILREKTVWDLVRGNKLFNGEVIVRDPAERGRVLTGEDSAVEITKLQSMMSLLDDRPLPPANERLTLHHLLIDVKAFVGASTEATTLVFFLASRTPGQTAVALSESYIVEVPPSGTLTNLAKAGPMRTLFTNLASSDIGDLPSPDSELYLVVKIRSTQQIMAGKPGSRGSSRDGASTMRNVEKPQSSSGSKSGRRSLMWGQKAQKSAYSRNAPITSRLNSLSEQVEGSRETKNHDRPPNTADSRALTTVDTRSGSVSRIITRTVGIGALKINAIMKQEEEIEQVINVWTSSIGFKDDKQDMGEGWEDVIPDLMHSQSGAYEKSRKAERLQVHLTPFESPDAEGLIKATPTLLSGVTKTAKMGFSGAPTKARSDIYVTLDEAFLPRHALLSRSSGSATPLSSNLGGTNLQITLEVRKASGDRLEGCIFASSSADGESCWESAATERGDAWNQTLRLAIPPNDVPGCHLVMVLADIPTQPFAIGYMPLWDQQAFMRDGHHSLLLYRYDETTSSPKTFAGGRGGYLNLPWNARGKDDVSKDEAVTGPIATLRLQTYLCSTRFSQDKVLLGLLKWKEQPPGDLQELLKRLVFVPEIEVVKLLSDVFDAIFGILVEHTGNDDYEDLIFSALVTVLGIVHDRRFNLGPLVDQYAENKFNYPFATPCLVRSFTRLLAKPSDPETSRKLRATFKVVKHILKFITHARGQQKAKEAGIGITSTSPGFTRHLRSIFKALDGLMRNTAPILVGSQTLAVQHFHTWLPELTGLLDTEEILHIAIDFMDSCALVKGKLVLYKLVLIINYSNLELFSQSEQRAALSANTVRWIAPHWGKTPEVTEQWREQVRLCCSILSTQVQDLGPEVPDYIPKIIDSYLALQAAPKTEKTRLSLLFPTTYPFPTKPLPEKARFDEALVELSAILSGISTLPAGMQLELAEEEMASLLEDTLLVHLSILRCEAFPSNWLSVHIYHHKSTMKTLEYLAGILLESFLPHPDDAENYNTELWKVFFTVLLKLVGSDALALETYPEQKRRAVWKIAGDIREHGADLLRRTWEAIGWETSLDERQKYNLTKMGGYQVQYVPVLVGPIVELCLSVHEGLRRVAVEVLQTMIVSEWTLSEDLSVIQMEMIDCLDRLFKSKPLTESILQKLFINELLGLFEPLTHSQNDPLYSALKDLIATIDEFLDLLVAVHSTDVTGEASHMIHRLRLMEFLRDMQKEEIFIRYVHQLAQLQADARNPTEAGLALRLHADLYEWEPTKMVPALVDPEFPAQTQFDRKERIYFDIIKYFEDGEAWSSALAAYQELQVQYQDNVYDFPKLARTQRAIATIYETIAKSDKLVPKYFRVQYKGMGFPPSLRDKEFVFEGSPTERTSAFTDRMQEQHPAAQIVNTGDVEDVEGQFLQISTLTPHRDLDNHIFQRARVPQIVRDYLLSTYPQHFSVTSKRNTSGPVNEHSAEKIVYSVAETFPTILRRSEIVAVNRIKLNNLQTALERVIRKTQEMSVVEKRVADGEEDMAPLLIDALNISVNPNSDSSVARYRELLPSIDSEEVEEVELSPLETALKIALIDHAIMIKRCLSMFSKHPQNFRIPRTSRDEAAQSKNSPPSHQLHPSLHASILKSHTDFEATFGPELSSFSFPQPQRDPTPVPSWSLASPVLSMSERRDSARMPHNSTNGTIATLDTGILDLSLPRSTAGVAKNRLSFLKRAPPSSASTEQAAALGQVNGNGSSRGRGIGSEPSASDVGVRSRSKENKRSSFFGGQLGNGNGVGGGAGRGREMDKGRAFDEDGEWVTSSDLTSGSGGGSAVRRSSSLHRPDTSSSVASRVGSVRKRLSKLTLGKKSSKASVLVDSVAEE